MLEIILLSRNSTAQQRDLIAKQESDYFQTQLKLKKSGLDTCGMVGGSIKINTLFDTPKISAVPF